MHLLVALVAKHDAVADRLPKFGESCEWQNVVQLHSLVLKRLSAMWATSALSFVQLSLVLDAMVLHVVPVHQIADRSFLHPTIRDVEVQPPDA